MKVLITGAAGVLGKAVTALVEQEGGYVLRLSDTVPLDTPHEFVAADLAQSEEVKQLCDGVEQVLHLAGIHPWKSYTPEQYLDCNIKGTCNLLQAAAEAGVKRVIYTSSIAAMGYLPDGPEQLPMDETKPCRPLENLYGVSKHVGEQFCEMFWHNDGLDYLALRPACFIPCDEQEPAFGLGLLGSRIQLLDVAQAHLLALKSEAKNQPIIIATKTPFAEADGPALYSDARSVILKYFPEAIALEAAGIKLPEQIRTTYNIARAEQLLGYRPQLNFEQWLEGWLSR